MTALDLVRERVLALLRARGWSQSDLSRESGVGNSSISEFLSGAQNLKFETVDRFAEAFKVDPIDLFCDRDQLGQTNAVKAKHAQLQAPAQARMLRRPTDRDRALRSALNALAVQLLELAESALGAQDQTPQKEASTARKGDRKPH